MPTAVQSRNEVTPEDGVYYPKEAYAGFLLRLVIDLIDLFIVLALCVAFSIALVLLLQILSSEGLIELNISLAYALLITWALVWFAYFVVLKGSRFHTIGYRIGKTTIVNLQGKRPGLYALTLRLLFAAIGPINTLIDLIWLLDDPCKQALRDKFAHTYVIKRDAQVAGRGRILYRRYSISGLNFLFPEVDSGATSDHTN